MFQKFRFSKCYYFIARITLNFAQRLNNSNWHWHPTRLIAKRRNYILASLAGFSFHATGILDEEFVELKRSASNPFKHPEPIEGWEIIYSDQRIAVFRRKLNGKEIYEYRCIGSYLDISVENFIRAQYDVEYRQKWDENVKSLEVLEEETGSGMQIIRWETKYPYPMSPRLYIYVQRKSVDSVAKSVMVVSRAVDESEYPDNAAKKSTVRVNQYSSKLLVRAHGDMDKNGLDFVLIYHDDPKAPLPKKVYEFGVNVVGPKFLNDVHKAALKLAEEREKLDEEKEQQIEENEEGECAEQSRTEVELQKEEENNEAKVEEKTASAEVKEEEADPLSRWRAKCEEQEKMKELKAILVKCNERVRAGSEESCQMEMVDWITALDHCAMPKAFSEIK